MKYRALAQVAVLAAAGTGATWAQGLPEAGSRTTQDSPVVTDTAPSPAEDRGSSGAIVLEKSMVQAQRDNAFSQSAARTGVESVSRGATRITLRQRTLEDLAQARADREAEFQRRGAASFDEL